MDQQRGGIWDGAECALVLIDFATFATGIDIPVVLSTVGVEDWLNQLATA